MATRTLTAILHKEGGLWVAECPEVGAFSQGSNVEDALANLKEATEVYLEEFPWKDGPHAFLTTFEAKSD